MDSLLLPARDIDVTCWVAPLLATLLASGIWKKILLSSHSELLSHSTGYIPNSISIYIGRFSLGRERKYKVVFFLNTLSNFSFLFVTDSVVKDIVC